MFPETYREIQWSTSLLLKCWAPCRHLSKILPHGKLWNPPTPDNMNVRVRTTIPTVQVRIELHVKVL